jgi:thiamine-phosphate pyrophosphorylase
MGPVLCLITDRRRWGGQWRNPLVAQVAAAARAGIQLIQVREPDLAAGALRDLVGRCLEAVRGTPARVVVNDRLDVALAAGAHGVHLRGDSMPARRVRSHCPRPFLIGSSVHAVEDVRRADSAVLDYLVFGTVFATASKPGRPPAGVETLADAVRATTIPVLAVGGVTFDTMPAVRRAGAAGAAAIGVFTGELDAVVDRLLSPGGWIDTAAEGS